MTHMSISMKLLMYLYSSHVLFEVTLNMNCPVEFNINQSQFLTWYQKCYQTHQTIAKPREITCSQYSRLCNSHDVHYRVVPQDFMRHIDTHVEASVCVFNAGGIAWPHLQPIKTENNEETDAIAFIFPIPTLTDVFQ